MTGLNPGMKIIVTATVVPGLVTPAAAVPGEYGMWGWYANDRPHGGVVLCTTCVSKPGVVADYAARASRLSGWDGVTEPMPVAKEKYDTAHWRCCNCDRKGWPRD